MQGLLQQYNIQQTSNVIFVQSEMKKKLNIIFI